MHHSVLSVSVAFVQALWLLIDRRHYILPVTFLVLRWLRFPSPKVSSTMHIRSLRDVLSKVDLLGMISLVSCLSFLVVALNSGGQTVPWGSSLIVGMLCALGVSGIAFCVVEGRYAKMPIAPGRLFVRWGWRNVPIMMITRTLLFFHNFAMVSANCRLEYLENNSDSFSP